MGEEFVVLHEADDDNMGHHVVAVYHICETPSVIEGHLITSRNIKRGSLIPLQGAKAR